MDDTKLANEALSALGTRSSIASFREVSVEADAIRLIYRPTVDELQRKYWWKWGRRQVNLAVLKAAKGTPENPNGAGPIPPMGFRYSYAFPAGALDLRYILPIVQPGTSTPLLTGLGSPVEPRPSRLIIPYVEGGDDDANGNPIKVILTDQPQAIMVISKGVYDPNVWDSLFQLALIGRLARKLLMPLSGDMELAKLAISEGVAAENEAATANAADDPTVIDRPAEWTLRRGWPDDGTDDID